MEEHDEIPAIEVVRQLASWNSDICDHLETIYTNTIKAKPRVIVELGVRGGISSRALGCAALVTGATLIGIDIDLCRYDFIPKSIFLQGDDVELAAKLHGILFGKVDVLFIDTSHLYEHTLAEIEAWFPMLSRKATVMLHDTNLNEISYKKDGTQGVGWDNSRGVIKALEAFFEMNFDETNDFDISVDGWFISHQAVCNGFTTLLKKRKLTARV